MSAKQFVKVLTVLTFGCLAVAQVAVPTVTYSYNGPPINITYTTGSAATFASIQVPYAVTITKVTVTVNISYPAVSDLNLYLFGPDGTRTKLLERNCSGTPNATLVNTTFDDSASSTYNSFCPAEAGRGPFKSNEPLSNYNNKSAAGTWTLAVQNNVTTSNSGVLSGFNVTISGTTTTTPVISANTIYNALTSQPGGPIAPGEIVAISGTTIGPVTAVSAPAGNLPTTLGNVQVTINSTPIPLLYVSSTLVLGIVPYSATGSGAVIGGTVTLVLTFANAASNSVTIGLAAASPGLFTVSRSDIGKTVVKAVNSDGTLNGPDNPAAAGSVMALYAGGLGLVSPTFTAGQVAPSDTLYMTTATTFASIAGAPATVLFSGLAPGTIGAYQVNIQIPSGIAPGAQPFTLWNSAGSSQNGLQIYIK
jgi:uncharacterized protein (TIGR03437 family)